VNCEGDKSFNEHAFDLYHNARIYAANRPAGFSSMRTETVPSGNDYNT